MTIHAEIEAFLQAGGLDRATKAYEKAIQYNTTESGPWRHLVGAYKSKGDFKGVIRLCKRALNLNPTWIWARAELDGAGSRDHGIERSISPLISSNDNSEQGRHRSPSTTIVLRDPDEVHTAQKALERSTKSTPATQAFFATTPQTLH